MATMTKPVGPRPGIGFFTVGSTTPGRKPAFQHFNYDELDGGTVGIEACTCALCLDLPQKQETYESSKFTELWHQRFCKCDGCIESRENREVFMAALMKREIYCELSYLTHEHWKGSMFLTWLYDRMIDPQYHKQNWWANSSVHRTCIQWIVEWQESFLPRSVWAVSGICSVESLTFK